VKKLQQQCVAPAKEVGFDEVEETDGVRLLSHTKNCQMKS
jgi:hypothetical protein